MLEKMLGMLEKMAGMLEKKAGMPQPAPSREPSRNGPGCFRRCWGCSRRCQGCPASHQDQHRKKKQEKWELGNKTRFKKTGSSEPVSDAPEDARDARRLAIKKQGPPERKLDENRVENRLACGYKFSDDS